MGAAWVGCDCVLLCARDGSRVKTCTHVPAQLFLVSQEDLPLAPLPPFRWDWRRSIWGSGACGLGSGPNCCQTVCEALGLLPSARHRELSSTCDLQPCGSEGQVLPHPSLHPRVGVGEQGWRPLWSLALELCWNQNGAWQALWESVQASVWRLVHTLPRAAPYGPT